MYIRKVSSLKCSLVDEPTPRRSRILQPVALRSEKVLQSVKDTHILIALFPLSILDIREMNQQLFGKIEDSLYKLSCMVDRGKAECEWLLVKKAPVENSMGKTWDEQQLLLEKLEKFNNPSYARVMVYTIIGHFLATNERLFEEIYVRCHSIGLYSEHLIVGFKGLNRALFGLRFITEAFFLRYPRPLGRPIAQNGAFPILLPMPAFASPELGFDGTKPA